MHAFAHWATLTGYVGAAISLWLKVRQNQQSKGLLFITMALLAFGFGFHSLELYLRLVPNEGLSLSLGNSLLFVSWMAVLLYMVASVIKPAFNLGLVVLPITVFATAIGMVLSHLNEPLIITERHLAIHISLAVITFGVLSLAVSQAFLVIFQDHRLRQHLHASSRRWRVSPNLPPLLTMESLLYQLLVLGFLLLTINLGVGIWSSALGKHMLFEINHHNLLTLAAWLAFAVLLAGTHFRGWRGQQAARYTVIGFVVFFLGYFGPRIVQDLFLG